ncbi:MAG: hypothetical protein KIT45_13975 [Fimbriimonadia bacterium]|nr:hypothetical protein [Fimbriimonadia bacterium]
MHSPQTIEVDLSGELAHFRLPSGVKRRLEELLDKQEMGEPLTSEEQLEAEGLVELAEFLSLLRLRSERLSQTKPK